MNPTQQALCLPAIVLALIAPASAWATCTTSVVDLGLITTVRVTASTDEDCRWDDNNPHNSRLLSMVGSVVPVLLQGYRADFVAGSSQNVGETWELRDAECDVVNIPGCTGEVHVTGNDDSGVGYRDCQSENSNALTSTNVCIFQRVVP